MPVNIVCPSCRMTVPIDASASAHASADGPVHYLRCVCGWWIVLQAGEPIGGAGRSDLHTAGVAGLRS